MPRVKTASIGPPIAPKMEKAMRNTPAGTTCRRKATPIIIKPKTTAGKGREDRPIVHIRNDSLSFFLLIKWEKTPLNVIEGLN